MKKLIFLLLILPVFVFGQFFERTLFGTATDTISNITKQDTLSWRLWIKGSAGPWNDLTNYITSAEKKAETNQIYNLSGETNWQWGKVIEFQINSGDTLSLGDILTGAKVTIGSTDGVFSAILKPDTAGTNTTYTLEVGGQ